MFRVQDNGEGGGTFDQASPVALTLSPLRAPCDFFQFLPLLPSERATNQVSEK